MAQYIYLPYPV